MTQKNQKSILLEIFTDNRRTLVDDKIISHSVYNAIHNIIRVIRRHRAIALCVEYYCYYTGAYIIERSTGLLKSHHSSILVKRNRLFL